MVAWLPWTAHRPSSPVAALWRAPVRSTGRFHGRSSTGQHGPRASATPGVGVPVYGSDPRLGEMVVNRVRADQGFPSRPSVGTADLTIRRSRGNGEVVLRSALLLGQQQQPAPIKHPSRSESRKSSSEPPQASFFRLPG